MTKNNTIDTQNFITVQGAREHNLKNVDVTIPRNQLTVITGLSGSGKSSLAFDTIYADGQRRYVESLSAYARQFLEMMQKPDVDQITGLSPAISIEQKTTSKNPRSTVGTVTEIYDYMRLLFARIGVPYSPETGLPITSMSVSQIVDQIIALGEGTKLYLLAPIVRGRKGEYRKELQSLQTKGFQRVKIDGTIYDIDDLPTLDKKIKHNIEVVVDRIAIKPDMEQRLAESVETALDLANGIVIAQNAKTDEEHLYSSNFACPVSGFTLTEIEPRMFSFNNPFGACGKCDGLGTDLMVDPNLIVPDGTISIIDGAIAPWGDNLGKIYQQTLDGLSKHYQFKQNTPWNELDKKIQKAVLFGDNVDIEFLFDDTIHVRKIKRKWEGVIPNLERRFKETDSDWARDEIEKYQNQTDCSDCEGYRLKPETLAVKVNDFHIGHASALSIKDAQAWFNDLPNHLNAKENSIAVRILKEINDRLGFLVDVGLEYLTLSRTSGTLSGGESQRIRLASQIGSGLTGVLYVLDEPSIGLHQRDNDRLLETLKRLRDLGNTVIVVEHDEDAIRTADYLVDMGPHAGMHGGEVIAAGLPDDVINNPNSITGAYMSGKKEISVPKKRRSGTGGKLSVIGASANNLKDVTIEFPLGTLTCVTGVSGSGKSTLTIDTMQKALSRQLMRAKTTPGKHKKITGVHHLDKIIDIDQSPIGRTPRSNPATYTGAFTPIREWFAALPEAKARGYSAGRFSFNVKGGRCETCQGDGVIKIEMHFLPDVYVECDQCKGKRYNRETLDVKYKGKSISDVLEMTVEEANQFFEAVPSIRDKMATLEEVGLGYIKVGQQATTLSGGEAQRIKLAKELSKKSTGRTLYVLDEPTTGLHFEDVNKLLGVLQKLVDSGNTMVIIEHNLDVIKCADWIIDMGPEGGDKGGNLVGMGTPEDIVKLKDSYTGRYLKDMLKK